MDNKETKETIIDAIKQLTDAINNQTKLMMMYDRDLIDLKETLEKRL